MRCDRCGEQEATIHEVLIDLSGAKLERHLCEACAAAAAQANTAGGTGEATSLEGVVASLTSDAMQALAAEQRSAPGPGPVCPACGTTFAKFRKTGLLGCPACYGAFGDRLARLIERAHEGGVCHVGKSPTRAGDGGRMGVGEGTEAFGVSTQAALASLRKQLDAAVRGEQYERAATLKREIERLASAIGESGATGRDPAGEEGHA